MAHTSKTRVSALVPDTKQGKEVLQHSKDSKDDSPLNKHKIVGHNLIVIHLLCACCSEPAAVWPRATATSKDTCDCLTQVNTVNTKRLYCKGQEGKRPGAKGQEDVPQDNNN